MTVTKRKIIKALKDKGFTDYIEPFKLFYWANDGWYLHCDQVLHICIGVNARDCINQINEGVHNDSVLDYLKDLSYKRGSIDLRNCKQDDLLLGTQNKLMTYWADISEDDSKYMDHQLKSLDPKYKDALPITCSHDGYMFYNNRKASLGNDVVLILKMN